MAGNLLERAISCDDGDRAAKINQDALGIELDDVANYVFPRTWPADREQRARIIGEWLQTEGVFSGVAVPPAPSGPGSKKMWAISEAPVEWTTAGWGLSSVQPHRRSSEPQVALAACRSIQKTAIVYAVKT